MDKRFVAWASVAVIGLIAMTDPQIVNTLLSFLVLGIIPGTDNRVPEWVIYAAYATAGILLSGWLLTHTLYIGEIRPVPAAKSPAVKRAKKKPTHAATKRSRPVKRKVRATV